VNGVSGSNDASPNEMAAEGTIIVRARRRAHISETMGID
jgi:hypothetical protein